MGLRINTNTQSMSAQRNLGVNSAGQQQSLEKLASGSRIVRAADDAAGLAISEKMRAQIRTVRQDIRNANDGISMIQTAEGAIAEVSNILVRFRELATQGASDTIGDAERGFIDKEVQQLKTEISRIANSTEYNGHKILAGTGQVLEFQIGLNNDPELDRFKFDLATTHVTADKIGVSGISVASKEGAQQSLDVVDNAIREVSGNRAELGALQNRLTSVVTSMGIFDENLSAGRSRIHDVDMASETSELTKRNILVQAGTAVLSQANSNSLAALKLIG